MNIENLKSKIQNRKSKIFFIALAALTVIPYLPSLFAPFAASDDIYYIKRNPLIQEITLDNLWAIFTRPYFHNYLPFHLLNYAIDHLLWGNNPVGYRAENIIWHVASALMAFVIFKRLMRRTDVAVLASLFFGIHPICVGSVAWIAERKNVMSQFFGLLSFWLYMTRNEGRRRYLWSVIACFAGLFSKTSIVVLPVLLMIYQWVIEGEKNWKKLALDKTPFFVLAIATGLATVFSQKTSDLTYNEVGGGSAIETVFTVSVVWVRFIAMTFLPVRIAEAYEVIKWGIAPVSLVAVAALVILMAAALKLRRSRPLVTLGALWFFIALLPVSNIIWLSVALKNRYLYLPIIGACFIVGDFWGLVFARKEKSGRAIAALTLICMTALTFQQSYLWRRPVTTWRWTVRVAPQCVESHINLASAYLLSFQMDKRNEQFGIGRAMFIGLPSDRISVARFYLDNGKPDEALVLARKMLPAAPDDARLLATAGIAALRVGKTVEARKYLERAEKLGSNEAITYMGLGILAADRGDKAAAIDYLDKSLEMDPNLVDAHLKLAALLEQTDPSAAIFHFHRVIQIAPDHPDRKTIENIIERLFSKVKQRESP